MKRFTLVLAATLLPLALSAGEPSPPPTPPIPPPAMPPMPPMPAHTPTPHVMYDPAQLAWGDPPPALERGAQVAVLTGDPGASGPFVLRLKAPPGYKVALHWHPTDEQVTVIDGELTLAMGGHGEAAHTFGPGGYALLPAQMQHMASTRRGATVQISGMGPFEIHYVDPKDDPRLRAPTR